MTGNDVAVPPPGPPEPSLPLPGGRFVPLIGFGTWPLRGEAAYRLVRHALDVGYRHLDTATFYENEAEVGRAVRDSGIDRDDIFVTTKLPPGNAGRERATIEASIAALRLDRVDLWLVHWPPGGHAAPGTWGEMLAARDQGLATHVGVSNYSLAQIDTITTAQGESPTVNQIKYGPALHDAHLLTELRGRGVQVAGWSPFASTNLAHPTLTTIARRYDVSAAQVVVRWHLQHEVVCLPRSSDEARIRANRDVLELHLSTDEMAAIDDLAR